MPEIYGMMRDYYSNNKDDRYVDMVRKLNDRGFLEILKEPENKNSIDLRYLKITEKFSDLLFISPDDIFAKFYSMYPSKGVSPDGYSYFTANLLDKDDKEYFIKNVLKNVNKSESDRILYLVSEMFDVGFDGKPRNFAKVGISKFIRNISEILKQWEEEQNSNSGNWNSKVY